MKLAEFIRGTVVSMTCVGLLTAQVAQAAIPVVRDIALQPSGTLQGQVLDTQGAPQAGVPVAVAQDGQVIATAKTDQQGRFQLADLRAGVYELQTPMGSSVYRLWAPRTAPPSAQDGILLVNGDNVVRGFNTEAGLIGLAANPWTLAAIVTAAIAIPLAVNNDAS